MRYLVSLVAQTYAFALAVAMLCGLLWELITTGKLMVGGGEPHAMSAGSVALGISWLLSVAYTAWVRDE